MMVRRRKDDSQEEKVPGSRQKPVKAKRHTDKTASPKMTNRTRDRETGKTPKRALKGAKASPSTGTRKVTRVAREKKEQQKLTAKKNITALSPSIDKMKMTTRGNRSQETVQTTQSPVPSPKSDKVKTRKTASPVSEKKVNKSHRESPKATSKTPKKIIARKSPRGNKNKSKVQDNQSPDDGYTADKDSMSSPASDLYDFESSEEYFIPSPVTASGKKKRKLSPNMDSGKPKKIAKVLNTSAVTNVPQRSNPVSKGQKKTGLNVSKGTLRVQAMKNCIKSSSDSGVFMTPSPIQDNSATFHVSISSKPSSTPTGVAPKKDKTVKKDTKLGAPLLPPPDLSPVKCVKSPNSGDIHGNLLSSPENVDDSLTPVISSNKAAPVETEESEFEALPTLDISKTYKDSSFRTMDEKKGKERKTKKEKRLAIKSKWELEADKKATEFEELENFELSIEVE